MINFIDLSVYGWFGFVSISLFVFVHTWQATVGMHTKIDQYVHHTWNSLINMCSSFILKSVVSWFFFILRPAKCMGMNDHELASIMSCSNRKHLIKKCCPWCCYSNTVCNFFRVNHNIHFNLLLTNFKTNLELSVCVSFVKIQLLAVRCWYFRFIHW